MPAMQVQSSLGRGRGHRHFHGRDDHVRARGGGFLGGVVRTLSDDLARARRSRQASRGAPQGREGRRRRESRTRDQVWRAVDPVARRNPGWARGRPRCRGASSRRPRTAIAASARRLIVDPPPPSANGASVQRGVARAARQRGPRRDCAGYNASAPTRRRPKDARGRIRFRTPVPWARRERDYRIVAIPIGRSDDVLRMKASVSPRTKLPREGGLGGGTSGALLPKFADTPRQP
jgi:hypothetical protein